MTDCKKAGVEYFELPVAYDALTVMVNPKNSWIKSMTVAELKKSGSRARAAQDHQVETR